MSIDEELFKCVWLLFIPLGVRIIVLSQRWTSLQRRFITMYDKNNEREEMLNAKPKQMFPQPLD